MRESVYGSGPRRPRVLLRANTECPAVAECYTSR